MHPESLSLLLSLLALLGIPCAIVLGWSVTRRLCNGTATPIREVLQTCAAATAITVAITLGISLILKFSGFFDRQFYRPSTRVYDAWKELGIEPESVTFPSADGTMLHGWFLRTEGDPNGTVICFHGSDRNITFTSRNVYWLTQQGFQVFVFDYRGYGQSPGIPDRKGLVDDSAAAIDYVVTRPDVDRDKLILYGQSMGGQLALNAAAIRRDVGIRLVIAEATYARPSYHLSDKLGQFGPLWLVKWAGWLLTSDKHSGEAAIAKLESTPVLLVHGSIDTGVKPYHSERLFDAAVGAKEIWRYDDRGHLQIFHEKPSQDRLVECLRKHLHNVNGQDDHVRGSEETHPSEFPVGSNEKP